MLERTETAFRQALDRLGELQRADFVEIFQAMAGLPVTVRLLDPPLHEFLPVSHFEAALEAAGDEGDAADEARSRLALARDLEEVNPMLGLRGIRLAVMFGEAAAVLSNAGMPSRLGMVMSNIAAWASPPPSSRRPRRHDGQVPPPPICPWPSRNSGSYDTAPRCCPRMSTSNRAVGNDILLEISHV